MDNKSKYELVKFALSLQKNLTLDEWKGLVKSAHMEKQAAVPIALWILGAAMAGGARWGDVAFWAGLAELAPWFRSGPKGAPP